MKLSVSIIFNVQMMIRRQTGGRSTALLTADWTIPNRLPTSVPKNPSSVTAQKHTRLLVLSTPIPQNRCHPLSPGGETPAFSSGPRGLMIVD
jgi:hypothetical protein